MIWRRSGVFVFLAALGLAEGPTGWAAEAPAPVAAGAIVVEAAQSIEWQRKAQTVTARGDAKAVRDDLEVRAQVLTAHYRERPDGATDVWRIDADRAVRITSPSESAYGEHGTFDLEKNTLTLSGGERVGMVAGSARITADRQLEYDTGSRILVARGNAVAVDGDRTLYGDVITVHLRDSQAAESRMQQIEADGRVRLVTPADDVRGDHGVYDVDTGIAQLDGAVQVIRGENVLNGCRGEINLKTGVSKLMACADGGGRVQGVILPQSLKKQ